VAEDYLLSGMALVAEHLHVYLDMNRPMMELMYMISEAANILQRKQKAAQG
jgi:hypothetical protein